MLKNDKYKPPFYGAAYYPEDWPLEQVDEDIEWMKKSGMNVMRIGEFAWSRMEPSEGCYDFGWLHMVVDKLAAAGIATIMGTPTCTPPAWLTSKYPEVLFHTADGHALGHGGRRHACPSSKLYRELCAKIVTRMAEEFGQDENIIGWQIDNEVFAHHNAGFPGLPHRASASDDSVAGFRKFLEERYGSIEALNKAWCMTLWSLEYSSFDQIQAPDPHVWHHPSFLESWDEFNSREYVAFVKVQSDILHKLTKHPIGTDMMPFLDVDPYEMHTHLDLVQFNHYDLQERFRHSTFFFDYIRPIKDRPYWNTETATCWGGGVVPSGYSMPGYCRANSWLSIAMGGEANLFWLWRTHWAGHELEHGSILYSCGRPRHIFPEIVTVSDEFKKHADFINETAPEITGLAIHVSPRSQWIFRNQPVSSGFNYHQAVNERVYVPLVKSQYRPDLIHPMSDLSPCRMLISPFLATLDEYDLRNRLKAWIEAGGIWIAGPMTDIRTMDGAKFVHAPYGSLEDWAGVYCQEQFPAHPVPFPVRWMDGSETAADICYDAYQIKGADESLAAYTQHELNGLSAITARRMGKGWVVLLGTMPPAEKLLEIVNRFAAINEVKPSAEASPNLVVIPRKGGAREGFMAVELECQPAVITLPKPGRNLITGELVSGKVTVPPYGVLVVEY